MTTVTAQESGRYTFPHGVHPPENKSLAEEAAIEVVATPKQVELPVLQHIGAPSKSTLKPRSEVTLGQEVLEAGGFVSAPAHAPIAGKTAKATLCTLPNGRHLECIPIKAAGEQLEGQALYDGRLGGDWPYAETQRLASEEIFARIQGRRHRWAGRRGVPDPRQVRQERGQADRTSWSTAASASPT
jgi:electron transport complex protein RnfC